MKFLRSYLEKLRPIEFCQNQNPTLEYLVRKRKNYLEHL
jgi:hypothetical protein